MPVNGGTTVHCTGNTPSFFEDNQMPVSGYRYRTMVPRQVPLPGEKKKHLGSNFRSVE